jgi:hypothetical protein
MALGAEPGSIRWLILRRALIQLAIGLTVGVAGAFGVGRLLQSMLVQIPTADPVTLTTIVAILLAIAIAACLVPSRRATRLDPATRAAVRIEPAVWPVQIARKRRVSLAAMKFVQISSGSHTDRIVSKAFSAVHCCRTTR